MSEKTDEDTIGDDPFYESKSAETFTESGSAVKKAEESIASSNEVGCECEEESVLLCMCTLCTEREMERQSERESERESKKEKFTIERK